MLINCDVRVDGRVFSHNLVGKNGLQKILKYKKYFPTKFCLYYKIYEKLLNFSLPTLIKIKDTLN